MAEVNKKLIERLRDPYERFIFQGGSLFAKRLADELERLIIAEQVAERQRRERIINTGYN